MARQSTPRHAVATSGQPLLRCRWLRDGLPAPGDLTLSRRTLRRRGQQEENDLHITSLAADWFPQAKILRPWPAVRFAVTHSRSEPDAGCDRKAGMSLPVKVWSVQSRAGRTGASLAGVAATRGPKRRQRLDGVWN